MSYMEKEKAGARRRKITDALQTARDNWQFFNNHFLGNAVKHKERGREPYTEILFRNVSAVLSGILVLDDKEF